jgi:glycosyltransferase involved in cell wall biosynthesis
MIALAQVLHAEGIAVELIGAADAEVRPMLRDAQRAGALRWYGFVPNDRALRIAEGAMAGLSLLHDEPNYRHSMPTKVVEYMAHGVPVVTTPLPPAVDIVESTGCGVVVPFQDPAAAVQVLRRLRDDESLRTDIGKRGYNAAREKYHWPVHAQRFVDQLEAWASGSAGNEIPAELPAFTVPAGEPLPSEPAESPAPEPERR